MPAQFWEAIINSPAPIVDGATLVSSSTLTDISPNTTTSPAFIIPANYLYAGQVLRVRASGRFSTTATPTLLIGVYYNGVAGTALGTTGAVTTPSGVSNITWVFDAQIVIRSIGTSGTAMTTGFCMGLGAAATTPALVPLNTPAVATINTTTANPLTMGAQWGTLSASNTLTLHTWTIEAMN